MMHSVDWIINAETITCLNNFDDILKEGRDFLTGVTVGRSDLSASMGIEKKEIESDEVFTATEYLIKKSKNAGLITNFGGNIGVESVPFIMKLYDKIERFETRKIVVTPTKDSVQIRKSIQKALEFELEYLNFKSHYYDNMASEDDVRKERLKKQINYMD